MERVKRDRDKGGERPEGRDEKERWRHPTRVGKGRVPINRGRVVRSIANGIQLIQRHFERLSIAKMKGATLFVTLERTILAFSR